VRRLQGYRYQANTSATQGITVVRVVIARDGRLLNVTVSRSSGVPEFDQGVLAGVRSGSPYAPLPPDIRGDSATFDLPLVSSRMPVIRNPDSTKNRSTPDQPNLATLT